MRRAVAVLLALAFVIAGGATYTWLVRTRPEPPKRHYFARTPEVAIQILEMGPGRARICICRRVMPAGQ